MNAFMLPTTSIIKKKRFRFIRRLLHLLFFDESGDFSNQIYCENRSINSRFNLGECKKLNSLLN